MSGWRHVERWDDDYCAAFVGTVDGCDYSCGCDTPTPDPESPCGYEWCQRPASHWWHGPRQGPDHDQWDRLHPHQPTRCTCGHAIERR